MKENDAENRRYLLAFYRRTRHNRRSFVIFVRRRVKANSHFRWQDETREQPVEVVRWRVVSTSNERERARACLRHIDGSHTNPTVEERRRRRRRRRQAIVRQDRSAIELIDCRRRAIEDYLCSIDSTARRRSKQCYACRRVTRSDVRHCCASSVLGRRTISSRDVREAKGDGRAVQTSTVVSSVDVTRETSTDSTSDDSRR
jgi:hypothetical protein